MDEKKIKEICGDVGRMDFEDASEAAKQLEDGDFLPQLKFDALKELEQRMSKIKTDECGLLVSKLLNAFDEAGDRVETVSFLSGKKSVAEAGGTGGDSCL